MIHALDVVSLSSAIMLGLLGSTHCIGMCGGIACTLGLNTPLSTGETSYETTSRLLSSRSAALIIAYNLGRISSYGLAGILLGLIGTMLAELHQSLFVALRLFAGLLLIAMGCYLGGWWYGLTQLERFGQKLWRRLQPLGNSLLPVDHVGKAIAVGVIWGWLPCGLVYSTLGWAATGNSWQQSGLLMLAFGVGTLPVMIASGLFASQLRQLLQARWLRSTVAGLIIAFGLWTTAGATLTHSMLGHASSHHKMQGPDDPHPEHKHGMQGLLEHH